MSLYGPEFISNGAFASETGWTVGGGWTISAGKAHYSGQGANVNTFRTLPTGAPTTLTIGKTYTVTYTLSNMAVRLEGDGVCASFDGQDGAKHNEDEDGTYTDSFVYTGTSPYLYFIVYGAASETSSFDLDDVSLKELSTADKIEEALFDLLRWNAGVLAITSSRIYPQIVPQGTVYPAIRYNQISGIREHTTSDTVNMVTSRFQIDCYGTTHSGARTLADAVRALLDNYHGTVGSVVIQCVHLIDENDFFEETIGVDQLRRYGKTQDYQIWYNE